MSLEESSPTYICGVKSLHILCCEDSPLSGLVLTGGGDSEYSSVANSTSVHSAEFDELKVSHHWHTKVILAVLGALGALVLFGAPNARNYQ